MDPELIICLVLERLSIVTLFKLQIKTILNEDVSSGWIHFNIYTASLSDRCGALTVTVGATVIQQNVCVGSSISHSE